MFSSDVNNKGHKLLMVSPNRTYFLYVDDKLFTAVHVDFEEIFGSVYFFDVCVFNVLQF